MLSSNSSLPPEVCDASVWYGPEVVKQTDWIVGLTDTEVAEVEIAVRQLEASDLYHLTAKDVPLPTLAPRLQRVLDEVMNGRGFVLIKGLPVERWT